MRINNFTIAPNDTEVISPEHIHINQIPAPNDFGLVFNTGSCTTDTGLQGIRNEPTPVDVTVRNLPLGCENTLVAGPGLYSGRPDLRRGAGNRSRDLDTTSRRPSPRNLFGPADL